MEKEQVMRIRQRWVVIVVVIAAVVIVGWIGASGVLTTGG